MKDLFHKIIENQNVIQKYKFIVRNIKYGFCLSMFENIEVIYNYEKISRIRYFLYFCLKSIKA